MSGIIGTVGARSGIISGGAFGITNAEIWGNNSPFTGDANPWTGNLQLLASTNGIGQIGSGMAESGGVFTFPKTGIWEIKWMWMGYTASNDKDIFMRIEATLNGSAYARICKQETNINELGSGTFHCATLHTIFDVQDPATHKVRFHMDNGGSVYTIASTTYPTVAFFFTRLGDT